MTWNNTEAKKIISEYKAKGIDEDIALRVYSARLLGNDPSLVLHGGGNSSVKTVFRDQFGKDIEAIHVKGSGWDMGDIEPEGFPTLDLNFLRQTRNLKSLSDEDMVSIMRRACFDPSSPNPSVETLLHAFLPHKYVDHTHSNSVLVLANLPDAMKVCEDLFGEKVAVLPWIMPGFELAKACSIAYEKNPEIIGIILLNHGIFSFGDTPKESYMRMLELVKKAESKINFKSLDQKKKKTPIVREQKEIGVGASMIRKGLSQIKTTKHAPLVRYIHDDLPINFINEKKNRNISGYGVITPDHVIRIKSKWLFEKPFSIKNKEEWLRGFNKSLIKYKKDYEKYFQKYSDSDHIMLDSLPRLIFVENIGLFVVGFSEKELKINEDLALANIKTQLLGIYSGGFKPLNQRQLFEMEYWSLEQKKLGKKKAAEFSGKVVVVTGGAGVIGSKTAMQFHKNGAEVVVIDRNDQELDKLSCKVRLSNFVCDLTDKREVKDTLSKILMKYGGIDILVMNSGIAIEGAMESIDYKDIESSFENNFWAHQNIASETVTIMKEQGIKGCLLFNITKQVFNQGKNFGAYGISKSAMLSLMRQYAIELGEFGIRSNGVNPDKIRSNILTPEMIRKRSKSRKTTESNYMRGNLLSREVKAEDVAEAFLYLASAESTTGAVISVDGGNAFSFVR